MAVTTTRKQSSASHEGKPCVDTTPIGTAGPMQPATLQCAVETIGKLQGRIEKLERPLNLPSGDEE